MAQFFTLLVALTAFVMIAQMTIVSCTIEEDDALAAASAKKICDDNIIIAANACALAAEIAKQIVDDAVAALRDQGMNTEADALQEAGDFTALTPKKVCDDAVIVAADGCASAARIALQAIADRG